MLDAVDVDRILLSVLPTEVWTAYRVRELGEPLARYLELIQRWNKVVSLTSVQTAEEMVRRHIAESVCCALALSECGSVLDLGSGGGFPGVPVQLMRPGLQVTLAESHGKKAAFLREVVRELGLRTEVFAGRAQEVPELSFGCVCLRAVDPMEQALHAAGVLARECVCVVGSAAKKEAYGDGLEGWELGNERACGIEGGSVIYVYRRRSIVPRGTLA